MTCDEDSGRINEFDKVNDSLMLHINQGEEESWQITYPLAFDSTVSID